MAAAPITMVVKGNPETKTLGDCPFCHRALLVAELKGLEYDKDYVDFANKPDWLFEKSPEGKVPVMRDGETWVADSADICTYLDEKYPDKVMGEGQLPGVAEKLFPTFVQLLKSTNETLAEKEAAFVEQLTQLDAYLAENGPFLGGDEMKGADAMVLPRLYHASVALPHFKKWSFPAHLTALMAYMEQAKQQPAFQNTDYGEDTIIAGWLSHGLEAPAA